MFKRLIITFILSSIAVGKPFELNPVFKSSLIPGWGEAVLENNKRARLFSSIELSLWTACLATYTASYHQMLQYQSFAVEHAGVDAYNKDHKYWVDIGNYFDIEQHNSEHLRWRYLDEIYDESDRWLWDNKNNMKNFESMRIRSDMLAKTGEYVIGAIIMNHLLSAIDTLYLLRLKKENDVTIIPIIKESNYGLMLKISL
ncbi:MAG: hypothetical protein CBC06_005955 [bacterium TMED46]|nr:MAG: hypothetical protein CBC06_005955 [bacterium TMED46]|tara:strand:- start:6985 stop:7584 length:600 start_codon:yes stop_codon:yes gene_type:complete